ncbi:RagB/SusD family nutrient uptake outer membrane protein [Chryseobacterium jejuense]|uniref:RagB/SusD family nutrient uptake outer membrane protein n=1 Tax=Chryseobacterium jejuense TaxID=445960 RepID=UPI001AE7434A|nr:RagB/SusD family nutrient uptake outer membrane protein [Chryseobacterium jejuense]MBP2618370.1 hypothetical protein [Chryseobacterium jejuense]
MKNIKIFAVSLLLMSAGAGIVSSCSNDFLVENPEANPPLTEAITNEKTLNIAVDGLYNYMQTNNVSINGISIVQNNYSALIPTITELMGDNAFVIANNSNRFAWTRLSDLSGYNVNNGDFGSLWNSLYRLISNANFILEHEPKVGGGNTANLYAQARTVRAMSYLTLVSFFSENYGAGNQEYGVPLVLKYDPNVKSARASVAEVYAQILSDLKSAEASIGTGNGVAKLNKDAVNILLSRYYLATKDYNKALTYSESVLSAGSILDKSGVANFFKNDATDTGGEAIFQVEYNGTDIPAANDGITATWYSGGRYKQNFATLAFLNKLGAGDIRKDNWYKGPLAGFSDNPKPVDVLKYTAVDKDVMVFRRTEAVFNKLEALYYTNPTLALTELNTWVKTNRDAGYNFTLTGTALLDEILSQKDIELFLEGFRYLDLKRNGRNIVNPQTGTNMTPANKQMKALPIPLGEIQTNPSMKQFPEY